jgi:hypothetical protein
MDLRWILIVFSSISIELWSFESLERRHDWTKEGSEAETQKSSFEFDCIQFLSFLIFIVEFINLVFIHL